MLCWWDCDRVYGLDPIFGAFIGCALGAFLIFMVDPFKALMFVILFLVLQQIEGNLIYPHVVGNSVGTSIHLGTGGSQHRRKPVGGSLEC